MMKAARAQEIGTAGLLYLAARPELFERLSALSGLSADDVRRQAEDPTFLGFVLGFLAEDEETAADFCAGETLTPEDFWAARALLPGGDDPHWT